MNYKLGLDIDGCILALYRDQFLPLMNHRYGTIYDIDDLAGDWFELWNLTGDNPIYEAFTKTNDLEVGLVDQQCPKYLQKLIDDGHFVELVTSHVPHHERGLELLLERLCELGVPYHSIRFTSGKGQVLSDKSVVARDYDFMLDDTIKHLDEMVGVTNPVRYIRPWNILKGSPKYLDVANWEEFYHLINGCSRLEIKGVFTK